MRELLQQLPKENYATLKYLIAFLVLVTLEEEVNKMSAMALAIVFGPAMFRWVIRPRVCSLVLEFILDGTKSHTTDASSIAYIVFRENRSN